MEQFDDPKKIGHEYYTGIEQHSASAMGLLDRNSFVIVVVNRNAAKENHEREKRPIPAQI